MSGVAGIIHFDGRPVEPGQIEAMTAAMAHRGPDGITHWRQGAVALGQCMLRTTPESLEEHLPLANGDGSLMLVMDGRVDNYEDLRRKLLGRGAALRSRADAELVLRAYEVWGEDCVQHIVGECVFFVWDARRRTLFAGRDAAGTRHFYYHVGNGWLAFASEIKGLLALPQIKRRLNDSRVLDYLVPEFDRDDEVGTFWQGIVRLPAGHALRTSADGVKTWRWWHPGELSEQKFASMAECTEAFMDQLRVAVRCRLRSIKPVGAMLSGGLDSSSIVGLISKKFRDQLSEPLQTVSLIRDDRENCLDWHSVDAIVQADSWLRPMVLASSVVDDLLQELLAMAATLDEPFGLSHGLPYHLAYRAAAAGGCNVMLDGMAGDVHFYSFHTSLQRLMARGDAVGLMRLGQAWRRQGFTGYARTALRAALAHLAPEGLRRHVRLWRQKKAALEGDFAKLHPPLAALTLQEKRQWAAARSSKPAGTASDLARHFTAGLISFGHETYGPLAMAQGVEPRSPFSDKRLIEFSVRMPEQAKLADPWYKHALRVGTAGMLPEATRWRKDIGSHPGWTFYERLARGAVLGPAQGNGSDSVQALAAWVRPGAWQERQRELAEKGDYAAGLDALAMRVLSDWAHAHVVK